jgi:hypothetical protein
MTTDMTAILGLGAIVLVVIGGYVLRRLLNRGIEGLFDSLSNKKARRDNAETPPQRAKLSDTHSSQPTLPNTAAPINQPPQHKQHEEL